MGIIETRLDRSSPDFQENTNYFQQLLDQLNERIRQVQQGGGEEATARHRKRKRLPNRTIYPAYTSSIRAALFCRYRPMFFLTVSTSVVSSTTRLACPASAFHRLPP